MKRNKVKSFTLSEMLVVMVITVIVVGLAFSVLNLVQKQIRGIEKNFRKTTELNLLEQRLWQDFNEHDFISYNNGKLFMKSVSDTVNYDFSEGYILRNTDTIPLTILVSKTYYMGHETTSGSIDALSLVADKEIPDYAIFISAKHDASHFINNNGL